MTDKKIIELDELVEEDQFDVRKIVAGKNSSVSGFSVDQTAGVVSLYDLVESSLAKGTRLTEEQTRILSAYETALGVFRVLSKEIRKELDVAGMQARFDSRYVGNPELEIDLDVDFGSGSSNAKVSPEVAALQASVRTSAEDSMELVRRLKPRARNGEVKEADVLDPADPVILEQGKVSNQTEQEDLIKTEQGPVYRLPDLKAIINEAVMFSNRYALHFAGQVGLALLNCEEQDTTSLLGFNAQDPSKETDRLTSMLVNRTVLDLQNVLKENPTSEDFTEADSADYLRNLLACSLTTWTDQFDANTWSDILADDRMKNSIYKFKEFSLVDAEFSKRHSIIEIDSKLMDVRKEDVVGPGELGETLWKNLKLLASYHPNERRTAKKPAPVIFAYGAPGCGKTFTAHAYIQSFVDLMRKKGDPVKVIIHSTTDYASHYQNKTANALAEIAKEIKKFQGAVVMYVADADNIFQSREDPRLGPEGKNTLGVYFSMFDGTLIPRDGKFLAIMDANYVDGIDKAAKSRFFADQVTMQRWTNPEHFSEYARRQLKSQFIDEAGYRMIGECLLNSGLSIRELGHVFGGIREVDEIPDEYVFWDYERQKEFMDSGLKNVTADQVIAATTNYVETRLQIERQSEQTRRENELSRLMDALETLAEGSTE